MREIRTEEDADSIREDVEAVYDGFYATDPGLPHDFNYLLDKIEDLGYDLGSDMNSPAIRRIRAILNELKREG